LTRFSWWGTFKCIYENSAAAWRIQNESRSTRNVPGST
jgi:hypothetical protein